MSLSADECLHVDTSQCVSQFQQLNNNYYNNYDPVENKLFFIKVSTKLETDFKVREPHFHYGCQKLVAVT